MMHLEFHVMVLVLLAAALHAAWNAAIKGGVGDPLVALALIMGTSATLSVGLLPFVPLPSRDLWPYLLASMATHGFYYMVLLAAYRFGDLNHVYPIARGTGPLWIALASVWIAGEALTKLQVLGVLLVSGGIVSLTFARGLPVRQERLAIAYAMATGVAIALYSLVDGLGGRRAENVWTYIVWMNFCGAVPIWAAASLRRGRELGAIVRRQWRSGGLAGVMATLAYGVVVWAMSRGMLANVAALRETSVIFAAVIGTHLLGERLGGIRITAAAIVAAGAILMNFRL